MIFSFFFCLWLVLARLEIVPNDQKQKKSGYPLPSDSWTVFVKVLSISVLERGVILVDIAVSGDRGPEYMQSKISLV